MDTYPREGLRGASPADLAWIAGSWEGANGLDLVEEHWSRCEGNAIFGMMRWVQAGRVKFYELCALEQDGAFVKFRIKHFDPGLKGWEDKDAAHEFLLVYNDGREAAFLELDKPDPRFAVYRLESADRLLSYFTRSREPDPDPGVFVYMRAK